MREVKELAMLVQNLPGGPTGWSPTEDHGPMAEFVILCYTFILNPSADRMGPTHIIERNPLCLAFTSVVFRIEMILPSLVLHSEVGFSEDWNTGALNSWWVNPWRAPSGTALQGGGGICRAEVLPREAALGDYIWTD